MGLLMINHLRIQNFKCWKDTGKITLSPITVFFGANSSGKSSIGQFLMMLKQTIESSDRRTVFFTGNETTAVDLGVPLNIVYGKDSENHIIFEYDWKPMKVLELPDVENEKKKTASKVHFSSEVSFNKNNQMTVESIRYDLETDGSGNFDIELYRKKGEATKKEYELRSDNYPLTRRPGRAWGITSPVRFYGFPNEAVAYYQNMDFLQNINLAHENLFSNVYYLGPLRNRAKRLYTWAGIVPGDAGITGEDAINALLASGEEKRQINLKSKSPRKKLEEIVAYELNRLSLTDGFSIRSVSNERRDYEVKVKTIGSENEVDIPDVGVGVSQVLPVVVELFYAPPGSTIIIEQPELHLHPSAQAALADVMIDAIHAKEEFKSRNIQLIIESHSEHFLRRLQRRLAEEVVTPEELSAYFIKYKENHAEMEPLQIDLYGDILNWPPGFFGDIQNDIYIQAKAGITRRMQEKKE